MTGIRDDRFHRRTFIFVDTFGFPFLYPYPYYGYYPYDYYGYDDYGYGNTNSVYRCSVDLLVLGTIMVPSMGLWDLKRAEQFALTNATAVCPRTADQSVRRQSFRGQRTRLRQGYGAASRGQSTWEP
jgi:hypothetical protein